MARRIVVALVAGIATGLFLGEEARILEAVADGFVKLLQMAVLPYVTVSIIGGIGALDFEDLRRLGMRTPVVLIALWALALGFAFLMPLTFPPAQSAAFFSTTLLERPPPFNLRRPLHSCESVLRAGQQHRPGAWCCSRSLVGVALDRPAAQAARCSTCSRRPATRWRGSMGFVVTLTPYGIFAIAATTAGTLRVEQAARLRGLPDRVCRARAAARLVGAAGPGRARSPRFRAREIFVATRDALLTAADRRRPVHRAARADRRLQGAGRATQSRRATGRDACPTSIVPVSYNFPHSGKLLSVSFVLFAAWFSDAAIPPADYPRLGLTALVTLFGSVTTAMPFLLDVFRVPADTFQLFVASGVVNSRFGTLVAAMHTVADGAARHLRRDRHPAVAGRRARAVRGHHGGADADGRRRNPADRCTACSTIGRGRDPLAAMTLDDAATL